jgi:hypothetical protein
MSLLTRFNTLKTTDDAIALLTEVLLKPAAALTENQKRLELSIAAVLANIYKRCDESAKVKMGLAATHILNSWTQETPPDKEARKELIYFTAEAKPPEILGTLKMLINEGVAINQNDLEFHARLLAALLDYQEQLKTVERYDVSFWIKQYDILERKFIGIIWSGMVQRDVKGAFSFLPQLATDKNKALLIMRVFPWVIESFFQGEEKKLIAEIKNLEGWLKEELLSFFDKPDESPESPYISKGENKNLLMYYIRKYIKDPSIKPAEIEVYAS